MNLFPKRKTLSISLRVKQEFTMSKKLKWQSTSKKSQNSNLPNQNQDRLSNSQGSSLFIDTIQEVNNDKIYIQSV